MPSKPFQTANPGGCTSCGAGPLKTALPFRVLALPGWGFGAFALSNVAWLTASAWQRQWPLHAQQWVFLVCSLLGLWNWWLGPLLLG